MKKEILFAELSFQPCSVKILHLFSHMSLFLLLFTKKKKSIKNIISSLCVFKCLMLIRDTNGLLMEGC